MVEIWQADAKGQYGSARFPGWGRAVADFESGLFRFETIKPGVVPVPRRPSSGAARGVLDLRARHQHPPADPHVFSEEATANTADPALQLVGQPALIETLIARKETRGNEVVYRFDIHLQGERETVFFDF